MGLDRLRAMEVFVAVAEAGGLAAAGAGLRMSSPAVSRALAALEDRLGTRLLNRTTRRVSLTEAGTRYLESARRLLGEIEAAERAAAGETAVPTGHLTITSPVTFGRMHAVALVAAFLRAEPRVTASVLMVDRVVNLVDEGIDLALRIGALPDSSLVAHRVGETRRLLVASPDYLARRGVPMRPEDLKAHDVIAFSGLMPGREWRHAAEDGRPAAVALSPRLTVNDAAGARGGPAWRGDRRRAVLHGRAAAGRGPPVPGAGALRPGARAGADRLSPRPAARAEDPRLRRLRGALAAAAPRPGLIRSSAPCHRRGPAPASQAPDRAAARARAIARERVPSRCI
jgi:DNA-binding transcriptional LysR family regulator